jgi:hypothetical protein
MLTVFFLPVQTAIVAVIRGLIISTSMTITEQHTLFANTIFVWWRLKITPVLQLSCFPVDEETGMNITLTRMMHDK